MLFLIYEAIVALLVVAVTTVMVSSRSKELQVSGAVVLIPLLLRLLGVK
ncbi:MAG: hypothetical protein AB7I50_07110 [Vicinamibacterales bacterium]